jgi:hypothetical protein
LQTPYSQDTSRRSIGGIDAVQPFDRVLVSDLEATLVPSVAMPGSIEAEVDGLVDCDDNLDRLAFWRGNLARQDPFFRKLWLRGFEAVPVLLRHLEDRRLTRAITGGDIGMSIPRHRHIGEVMWNLLVGLIGNAPPKDKRPTNRTQVEQWWKEASAIGEEAYLLKSVLPREDKEYEWLNEHALVLIAVRYPHHLPALYQTYYTQYHQVHMQWVDRLLHESCTSPEIKRDLLIQAVKMKHPRIIPIFIERLDRLPVAPPGPYFTCEAIDLIPLLLELDDPNIWKALERLTRHSEVGQRLEILHHLEPLEAKGVKRLRCIEFLEKFIEDQTLRVIPMEKKTDEDVDRGKYAGSAADADIERITVGDSALRNIATALSLPDSPRTDWTPAQWDRWRKAAREALQKYLQDPLG